MARTDAYKTEELITAAKQTGGNKTAVARLLNCSRMTVQRYCKRYKTVQEAFDQEREKMIDWAETGLRKAVIGNEDHGPEPWALKFTLKTVGKDRGYTERHEIMQIPDDELDAAIARELARLSARSETEVPAETEANSGPK